MTTGDPNLNTKDMSMETSPHWSITGSANCLPIGTRLAEFEITGVIGEGGFGNVYLAFDHSLQRTVAIKEYMPVSLASRGIDNSVLVQTKRHRETFETGMNSFINEARLLAQFDHPALIKVYRFWEQNKTAYMAMRYYEGQTFKAIITKHPERVTEAWLKPILKPILEALDTLYKLQVLHRDISPDNIMIQNTGEAVLLDFGAARQVLGDMTQALTVILKPGFAPVEQYAEDSDMKQGPWTDIYALCAVMYMAITKQSPPTSVTRLIKDPIELLQGKAYPGFSKEFLAAIDKGMAVKPHDRPQTIAEFSKLLGVDKGAQVSNLPNAKTGTTSAAAVAQRKPGESRDTHKAKPASGAAKPDKKNVSSKGSWALLAAGVVLIAVYGIYQVRHRNQELRAEADSAAAAGGAAPPQLALPAPPSASSPASSSASANAKSDTATTATAAPKAPAPAASAPENKPSSQTAAASTASAASNGTKAAGAAVTPPAAVEPAATAADQGVDATSALYKLQVKPWANVLVDGSPKGVSPPLKRLVLPEGKHQIKLTNPNFPDRTIDVTVNAKKRFGVIDSDFTTGK
ncbi:MAG TPA: serine/threonine-protein kinase [Burkholderiaceae bacterium]